VYGSSSSSIITRPHQPTDRWTFISHQIERRSVVNAERKTAVGRVVVVVTHQHRSIDRMLHIGSSVVVVEEEEGGGRMRRGHLMAAAAAVATAATRSSSPHCHQWGTAEREIDDTSSIINQLLLSLCHYCHCRRCHWVENQLISFAFQMLPVVVVVVVGGGGGGQFPTAPLRVINATAFITSTAKTKNHCCCNHHQTYSDLLCSATRRRLPV